MKAKKTELHQAIDLRDAAELLRDATEELVEILSETEEREDAQRRVTEAKARLKALLGK